MFTSDNKRKNILKTAFIYLICTAVCAVIGAVYEKFSHEVYSYYMIYAFSVPLVLGAIPFFSIGLFGEKMPGKFSLNAWNSGTAALTVGSFFKGVLDIYGTSNRLIAVYPIAAAIFILAGLIKFISEKNNHAE